MKARFLINNAIDNATLSSSGLVSTLPVDNLKIITRSRVARSNNNNSVSISGSFPSATLVTGFVMGNHNFKEGTSYQLLLYLTPDWTGSPVYYYDNGTRVVTEEEAAIEPDEFQYNLPIWTYDEKFPEVVLVVNSFTLNITNSTTDPMDFIQFARLFMGEAIETDIGVSIGHNISWKETTKQFRTEDGTLRSDIVVPSKLIQFGLDTINDSDRQKLQRGFARVGMRDDFFISLFPNSCNKTRELDYSGIVKLTKIPKYTEYAQNYYSAKYIVEEI